MLPIVYFNLFFLIVQGFLQLVTFFFLNSSLIEQLHFVTEKPLMLMETTAHSKQQFTFTEVVKKPAWL